ncbi:MAG: regulatory protein RecX [Planctomycetota bacterium]|nr:regulatory protein RecX [Planctomycetota bacterium]
MPQLITHLTPSPRDAKRVAVRVNNKPVATLPASAVAELGLAVGGAWGEALAERVRDAAAFDAALRKAAKQIDRRARSAQQARDAMARQGLDEAMAGRVIDRLKALGLIDDAALGRALIEETLARQPAGAALLRAKLQRRGLDEEMINQLVGGGDDIQRDAAAANSSGDSSDVPRPSGLADARRLAVQTLPKLARFDAATRLRRLAGLLARRGFDADTIESALDGLPGREAREPDVDFEASDDLAE